MQKTYKNILELVSENKLEESIKESHLSPGQSLEDYLDGASKDNIVERLLSDVLFPTAFRVSRHKYWRDQTITIL